MAQYVPFSGVSMILPSQIRMARAGLGWTIKDLSLNSDVSARTIKRIESAHENLSANVKTIVKIQKALEAAGIEFIGTPDDRPGIRLSAQRL